MMAYLTIMSVRLHELKRALKPNGSVYLHCDPTASHYLKIMMDGIFGPQAFKNEVVWKRTSAHNSARKWGPIHDTILMYAPSDKFFWNKSLTQKYDQDYIDAFFVHEDPDGRKWARGDLTGSGTRRGESGKPWRGIDVTAKGRHWAVPHHELENLDRAGMIHWPEKAGGVPRLKRYADDLPGMPLQDIITDIKPVHNIGRERLGYPTQKPVTLLERIIRASSDNDAVVLDPFCGCGTTIEAAQRLGRRWIGIDIAYHAVRVIEGRMSDEFRGTSRFQVLGIPAAFDQAVALAGRDKYQFQWWANYLFDPHAVREIKKGADRGIDGELYFPMGPGSRSYGKLLISAKGGKKLSPSMIREFRGVLDRDKAEMGLFVCLYRPTSEMVREAATAGFVDTAQGRKPRLQIVSIQDWFEGYRPDLPHGPQLDSAAFSRRRKRPSIPTKLPKPDQPELPLVIAGAPTDDAVVRHFNPSKVRKAS